MSSCYQSMLHLLVSALLLQPPVHSPCCLHCFNVVKSCISSQLSCCHNLQHTVLVACTTCMLSRAPGISLCCISSPLPCCRNLQYTVLVADTTCMLSKAPRISPCCISSPLFCCHDLQYTVPQLARAPLLCCNKPLSSASAAVVSQCIAVIVFGK